jgi:hypothetical protein
MRLYDYINWDPAPDPPPVIVNATEVASVFKPGEIEGVKLWEAFSLIRPPWEDAWFEYAAWMSDGGGLAFHVATRPTNPVELHTLARQFREETGVRAPKEFVAAGLKASHVVMAGLVVVKTTSRETMSPLEENASVVLLLNGRGELLENGVISAVMDERAKQMKEVFPMMIGALLYTLALLNCKNVTTVDHTVPEKVAKARIKRGQPPGVTYKTLAITLPGTKQPVRLTEATGGTAKGRHIVRGHFAHYGEHNKLFGRLTGTFYHPMHVRGRNKERKIVKDYSVREKPSTP